MSGDLCRAADAFDLAIVGSLQKNTLPSVLEALRPSGKTLLVVTPERDNAQLPADDRKVLRVTQREGWLDFLLLLGGEVLRHINALRRAEEAEQAKATLVAQATLGRYMLEMRHTLNNALTSILGNSELLLLEPGSLSASASSQIDTIRNMAMRMHEVLQRFSSLESELKFVDRQAEKEKTRNLQVAAGTS
jgi:signal transduction histidine kinase